MFCERCGARNEDTNVFCENCGAELTQVVMTEEEIPGGEALEITNEETYVQQPVIKEDTERKLTTKALAVLMAVVTMITMMLGWIKLEIDSSVITDITYSMGADFDVDDVDVLLSVAEFTDVCDYADDFVSEIVEKVSKMGGYFAPDEESLREIKSISVKIKILHIFLIILNLCFIAVMLGYIKFIYDVIKNKAKGAFFGQLSCMISILLAVIVFIGVCIANIALEPQVKKMIDIGAAMGLYATVLISVVNFLFISVRKDILRAIK